MKRNGLLVTMGSLANVAVGIEFQLLLAHWLGVSVFADAYALATMVPTLLATVLIGSAPSVLVPAMIQNGEAGPVRIRSLLLPTYLILGLTCVSVVGSQLTTRFVAPQGSGLDLNTYRMFLLICGLSTPFAWITAVSQSVLMGRDKFLIVGVSGAINGVGLLATAATLALLQQDGTLLAGCFLTGYVLQSGCLLVSARRHLSLKSGNNVRNVTRPLLLLLLSAVIYKSQPIIERSLASVFEGGPALIAYADKISQAVLLGSTLGIALISLPEIARHVANGQTEEAHQAASSLSVIIGVFTAPFLAAGLFSTTNVVLALYSGASLTPQNIESICVLLRISLIGVCFSAISGPVVNLLYSHGKFRIVAAVSVTTTALGIAISALSRNEIGLSGVVVGTSAAQVINYAVYVTVAGRLTTGNPLSLPLRTVLVLGLPLAIGGIIGTFWNGLYDNYFINLGKPALLFVVTAAIGFGTWRWSRGEQRSVLAHR